MVNSNDEQLWRPTSRRMEGRRSEDGVWRGRRGGSRGPMSWGRGLHEGKGTKMGQARAHLTTRFLGGGASDGRPRGRVAREARKDEGRLTRALADTESRTDDADSTKANKRCRSIEGITMVVTSQNLTRGLEP
jgi:hypothetical protein